MLTGSMATTITANGAISGVEQIVAPVFAVLGAGLGAVNGKVRVCVIQSEAMS